MKSRTTTGTFVESGEPVKIVDSYTEPRAAHVLLEHAWIGTTEFREVKKVSNHESCIANPSKWADMSSEDEFIDGAKEHEKGRPEKLDEVYMQRPLLSLSARDPHRRGVAVGGRWCGRPCIETALSSTARASSWIDGGRKFKSCNSGRELYAPFSGSPSKLFGRNPVCPESSLSPATSMHVSSPEAQEVVGEGECQADTDISGIVSSESHMLTRDIMLTDDTLLGDTQRVDHTDYVSRADDPFALAFGSSYKRRLKSCVVRCSLLPGLAAHFLLSY